MDRKEQNRIRMREWRKTPKGKKTNKIDDWRRLGLVDDYEKIYDIYLNTHECMKCNIEIINVWIIVILRIYIVLCYVNHVILAIRLMYVVIKQIN